MGKKAAAPPKAVEPETKKAKTEEVAAPAEAEPKVAPPEKVDEEKELNAPKDTRATIKDTPVVFDTAQTTLNVVPTIGGRVLMALSEGGMQHLVAGARGNVGVKAGRYMFGAKGIFDRQAPRPMLRVGFSVSGSSLVMDGEGSVSFDTDGKYFAAKRTQSAGKRFTQDAIVAVLLNLDPKSPNANTVSLFLNGQRASAPQALPEEMAGKALYPHVNYRGYSVQVHFGPEPLKAFPFTCRSLQDAAKADVVVESSSAPTDGKYDVLFPVAFPNEGTFDWLDSFLQKNPQYTELSERKLQEWGVKSGLGRGYGGKKQWSSSNDKPTFDFQVHEMDNKSAVRVINQIASLVPRHYVVMEVKSNLVKADRAQNLKRFSHPQFKRRAHVVMGEPKKEYKDTILKRLLDTKQAKAVSEYRQQKALKERQKLIAKKKKEAEEKKAKMEEEAKKRREALQKAKEEAEKAKGEEKKKWKSIPRRRRRLKQSLKPRKRLPRRRPRRRRQKRRTRRMRAPPQSS